MRVKSRDSFRHVSRRTRWLRDVGLVAAILGFSTLLIVFFGTNWLLPNPTVLLTENVAGWVFLLGLGSLITPFFSWVADNSSNRPRTWWRQ